MDATPGPFTGWYKEVCNELKASGTLSKLQSKFSVCKSDFERIRCVIDVVFIISKNVKDNFSAKSKHFSEDFRKQGNKLYGKNDCHKALLLYNDSIAAAEAKSPELYLALANRSAVNFALGQYDLCLLDVDKVLKTDSYPQKLYYKIHERAGKCFKKLGKIDEARKRFQEALDYVKFSTLQGTAQEKLITSIKGEINEISTMKNPSAPLESIQANSQKSPPIINIEDKHEYILCSSNALEIASNPEEGRHAIAARDISAGEVILVETPFSYVPVTEAYKTNCFHCLDRIRLGYPCRQCRTAIYCSEECEEKCWSAYHQYECKYLNILSAGDIGLAFLAYRMVIKEGTELLSGFEERMSALDDDLKSMGVNEEGKYDSEDYYCCYQLMGHSDSRVLSDLFRRTLIAVYLAKVYLQAKEKMKSPFSKDLITLIGGHLLKQIQMLPCNAHEISELEIDGQIVSNSVTKEIGSAIYATLSLLNHSCDPSVVRHVYGSVCVLRAIKHIDKGQPIIDNYGFLYAVEEKIARVKHLEEQYYFTCQCVACVDNWPLYGDMSEEMKPIFRKRRIENETNSESKSSLSEIFKVKRQLYLESMTALLEGSEPQDCLPTLLDFLDWMTINIESPYIDINNCQEMVKQCLGMMSNSFIKN